MNPDAIVKNILGDTFSLDKRKKRRPPILVELGDRGTDVLIERKKKKDERKEDVE